MKGGKGMATFDISSQLQSAAEMSLKNKPEKRGKSCAVYDMAVAGFALLLFDNGGDIPLAGKELVLPFHSKGGKRGYILQKSLALEFAEKSLD